MALPRTHKTRYTDEVTEQLEDAASIMAELNLEAELRTGDREADDKGFWTDANGKVHLDSEATMDFYDYRDEVFFDDLEVFGATEPEEVEPCHHPDFDWINPELGSDDPMDEVLACTECGFIRHTARQVQVA